MYNTNTKKYLYCTIFIFLIIYKTITIKYITDISNSNIVLNYSYGVKTSLNIKKCIVINESDIHNYIKNKKYVICTGSCTNCSYCKNKQDTRTVIFLNHVKKSITKMLDDNLNSSDIKKLEAKKHIDYGKFLLNTLPK